jgi:signal transduction histidine kinase
MGRLFQKLFFSFWLAMMVSFAAGALFLSFFGYRGPSPGDGPPILLPTATGALVAFAFSYALAWYLSRPLRHLRQALHTVAKGDFTVRVRPLMGRRRDEIADLCRDFDAMTDRLQQLVETRQRLLHDISHELRSPLTRMQAAIGLMRQDPGKTAAMVDRMEAETQRLDAMVGEVLTLARLEVDSGVIARERVDLIELLAAIIEDAAFEAEAAGRHVRFSAHGAFVTTVAAEVLCRAFENIIRNAVKYTAEGTAVDVTAEVLPGTGGLRVVVEDSGPGVPDDMLDKIFDPFLRFEASPQREGYGLGLAIARRAIESHHGRVWAERAGPTGGLRLEVRLPEGAV